MHDLGPATRTVADLVGGVREDQLDAGTPCPDFAVRDLLDHLDGLCLAFTQAARKDPLGGTPSVDGARLGDDWRTTIRARLAELAEAWRDPQAWTGETKAGDIDLGGDQAGQVVLNEVVAHGWDLARATGQDYRVDDTSVEAASALVSLFSGPGTEEMRGEAFGAEMAVADDATALDRLIAMNGRDPHWS